MKSVDLAIKAGRLRQNPITRWVHHSGDHPDYQREMIPIYENFCFALALFRTKTAENMTEAKAVLERLFAFQTPEGFPLYLHEYPTPGPRKLLSKLAVVAHFLLRDFSPILGETLRAQLQMLLPFIHHHPNPQTPEEWADVLIKAQITHADVSPAAQWWDQSACCFRGLQNQERDEPAVTLLDLIVGEWTGRYSRRALIDHPAHLEAALIDPPSQRVEWRSFPSLWSCRYWGSGLAMTHSAVLQTQGIFSEEGNQIVIDLPSKEVQETVEISYFINWHEKAFITVGGASSTTFRLGEPLVVQSGEERFEILFTRIEGKGRFWGHIYRGNRPKQLGCRGAFKYEAFDWHIAIRTIERAERCLIQVDFRPLS